MEWSGDFQSFFLEERISYPRIWFAFEQYVDLEQWGDAAGTYDSSTGSVHLPVTIRLTSSKGDVLDLPVDLTTDWTFGFNNSGEGLALQGFPRNQGNGDLKLVGIKNIPLEPTTFFGREPMILEFLGRLSAP